MPAKNDEPAWVADITDPDDRAAVRAVLARKEWRDHVERMNADVDDFLTFCDFELNRINRGTAKLERTLRWALPMAILMNAIAAGVNINAGLWYLAPANLFAIAIVTWSWHLNMRRRRRAGEEG